MSTKEKEDNSKSSQTSLKNFLLDRVETESNSTKHLLCSKESKAKKKSTKNQCSRRCRKRYEIVYRSILRKFRKFFNLEFDNATKYKSIKRYRKTSYFIECVSKYAKEAFLDNYSDNLVFSLCYLIYPWVITKNKDELKKEFPGLEKFLKKQQKDGIMINDVLYDFTFAKMKNLFANKQYVYLFNYFVEKSKEDEEGQEMAQNMMKEVSKIKSYF